MRQLPRVTAADLRGMKLKLLLAIRELADQHFFAEMAKRTAKFKKTGEFDSDSVALQNARNLQALVQFELATQAEEERSRK